MTIVPMQELTDDELKLVAGGTELPVPPPPTDGDMPNG